MGELARQFVSNELISTTTLEVISNPLSFNKEKVSLTKSTLDINKGVYSEYSDDYGSVKSFKKVVVDKNRDTGHVNSDIKTVNIIERNGVNFLSLKKFSVTRDASKKVSNFTNSLRLRLDKEKESNLPFLISTLLERNLL